MRLLFFLLILANLIFFVWTQGYLGAPEDGHEPLRLEQQLHAEKLRVLQLAQAPAAKRDEIACRVIGGLKTAEAEALKAALAAAGGEAKVFPLPEPALYLVVIADLANKTAADKKVAELIRFGIEGHKSIALEGGRHEIVLGTFPTEPAAREFFQGLAKRGIRSARVDSREQPATKARVETRAQAPVLLQQLPQLIAPYADATVGDCSQ